MPVLQSEQAGGSMADGDEFDDVWQEAATAQHKQPGLAHQRQPQRQQHSGNKQPTAHEEKEPIEDSIQRAGGSSLIRAVPAPTATAAVHVPVSVTAAVAVVVSPVVPPSSAAAVEDEWGAVNAAHAAHSQQLVSAGGECGIRPADDDNSRFTAINATQAIKSAQQPTHTYIHPSSARFTPTAAHSRTAT